MAPVTSTSPSDDLDVVSLPPGLPTIDLPRISLAKLLSGDEAEAKVNFDICTRTGFFYLNLMDHEKGRSMWEKTCFMRCIGQEVLGGLPMEEKAKRSELGIFDRGHQVTYRKQDGLTSFIEAINIPRDELFFPPPNRLRSPLLAGRARGILQSIMAEGFNICNIIYTILGRELQLPPGSLTSMHRVDAPSRSFVRILRYPGLAPTQSIKRPRFEAHRDITSIAVLFTWIAGLQIPAENAEYVAPDVETEESWQPLAGHAIVNLGDAMQSFTNGKLKSGKHRVVTAPGDQNRLDRYSVLVTSRPALDTPMKAF